MEGHFYAYSPFKVKIQNKEEGGGLKNPNRFLKTFIIEFPDVILRRGNP